MEDKQIKLIGGVVAAFFPDRGFGFIKRDDGEPDVFFHARALEKCDVFEVRPGDRLLFQILPSTRRPGSFEVGAHVERLNQDGSRAAPRAPRPALTLREAHEREEAAFARLAFVSKGAR